MAADASSGLRVVFPTDVGYQVAANEACTAGGASSACAYSYDGTDTEMIAYVDVYACTGGCSVGDNLTITIAAYYSYHTGVPSDL